MADSILTPAPSPAPSEMPCRICRRPILHGDYEVAIVSGVMFVFLNFLYYRIVSTVPRKEDVVFVDRLQAHCNNSSIGQFVEVIVAVMSLGSCVLFIWDTYNEATPISVFCLELCFSWLFMYQFAIEYFLAKTKWRYLTSVQAMVDIVTVTPVMITAGLGEYSGGATGFLRFTRVMKVTRVFRMFRLLRSIRVLTNPIEDAINHQMVELISTLLSMVVITAGFVQFLDSFAWCDFTADGYTGLLFHDALYYTVVTFSTVGYGDISPQEAVGRMVMVVLIVLFIYIIPTETNKLTALMNMRSRYDGKAKLSSDSVHVVFCCDESCTGVSDFLQQFFHDDHGFMHSHMVVLCPGEPDTMWKSLILKYKKRLTYLKGDMMRTEDLRRAQVQDSVGCFIMADRFCEDTNSQDATTILRALSVFSFNRRIKCFVQLIEPENRRHLMAVGISPSRVICHNEIKMGLMAQGCLWPGFSTMLANLLLVTGPNEFSPTEQWQRSYCHGAQQEVYRGPVGFRFFGQSFSSVVSHVYQETGALLIAVSDVKAGVMLHPGGSYLFKKEDFGFFIAANYEVMRELLDSEKHETQWCSFLNCCQSSSIQTKLDAKRQAGRERFEFGASIKGPTSPIGKQASESQLLRKEQQQQGGSVEMTQGPRQPVVLPPISASSNHGSGASSSGSPSKGGGGGGGPAGPQPKGVISMLKRSLTSSSSRSLLAGDKTSSRSSKRKQKIHLGEVGVVDSDDKPKTWGSHLGGKNAEETKRAIRSRHGSILTDSTLTGGVLSQCGLKQHGKMRRMESQTRVDQAVEAGDAAGALYYGGKNPLGKRTSITWEEPQELDESAVKTVYEQNIMFSQKHGQASDPWYRTLRDAILEYADEPVQVTGHMVVLCPTLDDIGALLEMLRIPHMPQRALVIVAPLAHSVDDRATREMEIDWEEIMAFDEVHLIVGMHDDPQTLFRANLASAHSVMILSTTPPEDGVALIKKASGGDTSYSRSRMDSALVLTAIGVYVELHHDKRVVAELNDSTVIDHFTCVSHAVLERGANFHDQMLTVQELQEFLNQDMEDVRQTSQDELSMVNFNYVKRMSLMKFQQMEQMRSEVAAELSGIGSRIGSSIGTATNLARKSTESPSAIRRLSGPRLKQQEARDQRQREIQQELDANAAAEQGNGGGLLDNGNQGGFEAVSVERKYQMSSSYVTGDVVLSNFSALLLCQAFFNPHIIGIISTLLGARMQAPKGDPRSQEGHTANVVYKREKEQAAKKMITQGGDVGETKEAEDTDYSVAASAAATPAAGADKIASTSSISSISSDGADDPYEPARSCLVQIPIPAAFLLAVARTREGARKASEFSPSPAPRGRPLAQYGKNATSRIALENADRLEKGQNRAKAALERLAEKGHPLIEFEYAALFAYMMHKDRDVLPVGVFRVGSESREGLSVRPFLDAHALSQMPKRSFLITNPEPEQLVCEHDLIFCLVYRHSTWETLKAMDSPYTNRPSPLSMQVKQAKEQAKREAAAGAARAAALVARQLEEKEEENARAKWERDMDREEVWARERAERKRREAEGGRSMGGSGSGVLSVGELQQSMDKLKQQGTLKDARIIELQAMLDKMREAPVVV